MGLSAWLAPVTFLASGVGYALGASLQARTPQALVAAAGLLGFFFLELSLRAFAPAWWAAAVLLGFWFGGYLTRAIVVLGWGDPDALGRTNAVWLALTDLPMALTPAVVWTWRAPTPGITRAAVGASLVVLSTLGMLLVTRRRRAESRAVAAALGVALRPPDP
jgi:hypothetical protein